MITIILQIEVPGLQARGSHCAGALVLSSRLTEVIIFGGTADDWYHSQNFLAATTVLRFSKSTIFVFKVMHSPCLCSAK